MTNDRIIVATTKEGTHYVLTLNGKSARFDDRATADHLMLLKTSQDAGRELIPSEAEELAQFYTTAKEA